MPDEQSFSDAVRKYKAEIAARPHPDANPSGDRPEPLIYCDCKPIDWPDPWYRRLADWIAGWFK